MIQEERSAGGSKPAQPKTFSCAGCGGSVVLRAVGHTVSVACQHCGALIDANDPQHKLLVKATQDVFVPQLPLGSRGQIGDGLYEVIGYLQKYEGPYGWEEYLLFNPYIGFRWLVQSDGHWTFVCTIFDKVASSHNAMAIEYEGRNFRCFNRGNAEVTYVLGEFYWRVKVGDKALGVDFVAAPYILSAEASDGEINWSLGQYVPYREVEKAFNVSLASPDGIGPCQPSGLERWLPPIGKIGAIAAGCLLAAQIAVTSLHHNEMVLRTTLPTSWANAGKPASLGTLHLSPGYDTIYVQTTAPVSNNWVEIEYSLVDRATNESYGFLQSIEYYHGSDSDGRWSEGSQFADGMLSSIPGGDYELIADVAAGANALSSPMSIMVERGRSSWQMFLLALGMIGIFPLGIGGWHYVFESNRWSNSDYTMFGSVREDDEDD